MAHCHRGCTSGTAKWYLFVLCSVVVTASATDIASTTSSLSKAVKVQNEIPAFLHVDKASKGAHVVSFPLPAAAARGFLVNSTSPSAAQAKQRSRNYVTPDGYNDTSNGTLAEMLNLPHVKDGHEMARWVICSWAVANISAADALRDRNNVFLESIPELLRSVQNLAPSQVSTIIAVGTLQPTQF